MASSAVSARCIQRKDAKGDNMGKADKDRSFATGTPIRQDGRCRAWGPGWSSRGLLVIALLATLLNSGCKLTQWVDNGFKVGPNYCKPVAPVASEWVDDRDPRVKSEQADLAEWWRVFNDPRLDALTETAYRQNISLRVAGMRILAARAQRGIAVGELFPQNQQAIADYTRVGISKNVANPFPKSFFDNWDGGFTASWELDFWGRFRRAVEAADAELDASIDNYDDVLVILLADVATNYTQLRTYQDRLRFAWLNVVSQYNSYQLAAGKFIDGAVTERDLQQAKQILEQTRALVPQFKTGIRQSNNQLCILLGIPPRELREVEVGTYEQELMPLAEETEERIRKTDNAVKNFIANRQKPAEKLPGLLDSAKDPRIADLLKPLEERQRTPVAPDQVVVGIPADLLRRRPDVRRAERQVAAQSARIGIAQADLYPHFAINGTIGVAAENFSGLFQSGSMVGAIGPSFRWDILNYGRLMNNVRVQDARFQELAFAYQNTVLKAGKEAEDGIVGYLNAHEQTRNLNSSVNAAKRTVQISFDQYHDGVIDFTPVVLFESTLAGQQDSLAVARSSIALNLIAAYRALGGGWEMRLARDGAPPPGPASQPPASLHPRETPEAEPIPPGPAPLPAAPSLPATP